MKKTVKHSLIIMLSALMLIASACGKKVNTNQETIDNLTPQPRDDTKAAESSAEKYGNNPKLEVMQSVAYLFKEQTGNELYAACEYKNTSDCPCIVTGVSYELNISEKKVIIESGQTASRYCIINPDETFYHAVWKEYNCTESDTVKMISVSITCEKSLDNRLPLSISDLYLVENYPGFASLSGVVHGADKNVVLNEIGVGFYDSEDKLIGVWYFTDSTDFAANKETHFTTHMRSIPIEGLTEKTVSIKAMGFGYNM